MNQFLFEGWRLPYEKALQLSTSEVNKQVDQVWSFLEEKNSTKRDEQKLDEATFVAFVEKNLTYIKIINLI